MPNRNELQEIARVTATLDPKTAEAMRLIFLLTEHHSEDMKHYLSVALQYDKLVSPTITKVLYPYKLVDQYGKIPNQIKTAIQEAIKTRHLEIKTESYQIKCEICGGPHLTKDHNAWVEKPEEMPLEDITAELEKYADVLHALRLGGLDAAEKSLNKMGLTMNGDICFCGTSNHTGAEHLRWLADKENER